MDRSDRRGRRRPGRAPPQGSRNSGAGHLRPIRSLKRKFAAKQVGRSGAVGRKFDFAPQRMNLRLRPGITERDRLGYVRSILDGRIPHNLDCFDAAILNANG